MGCGRRLRFFFEKKNVTLILFHLEIGVTGCDKLHPFGDIFNGSIII
jgi:hypothetical protein